MILLDKLFGRLGNRMFQMAYIYAQSRENGHDIYLQDPKYFGKYASEIKHMLGQNIPAQTNKVAIHVRRGDYVGNGFYVDLMLTDYYQRAMAEFPDSQFLVFSDDVAWCKDQAIFKDCEFSEGKNEEQDLNYMASCSGHIIANSSFSWWAAYLSPYTKKVIAPKAWYSDGVERTVCPNSWMRL